MNTIEHLTAADHAAVGCLLLGAYADYAERIGPEAWARLQDGLVQAAGQLRDAEIAGVRGPGGSLEAVVFYFPPGRSDGKIFPREWASLRLLGVAQSARGRPVAPADRVVHRPRTRAGGDGDRASHQRGNDDGARPV